MWPDLTRFLLALPMAAVILTACVVMLGED